jgi:hypothetical protein
MVKTSEKLLAQGFRTGQTVLMWAGDRYVAGTLYISESGSPGFVDYNGQFWFVEKSSFVKKMPAGLTMAAVNALSSVSNQALGNEKELVQAFAEVNKTGKKIMVEMSDKNNQGFGFEIRNLPGTKEEGNIGPKESVRPYDPMVGDYLYMQGASSNKYAMVVGFSRLDNTLRLRFQDGTTTSVPRTAQWLQALSTTGQGRVAADSGVRPGFGFVNGGGAVVKVGAHLGFAISETGTGNSLFFANDGTTWALPLDILQRLSYASPTELSQIATDSPAQIVAAAVYRVDTNVTLNASNIRAKITDYHDGRELYTVTTESGEILEGLNVADIYDDTFKCSEVVVSQYKGIWVPALTRAMDTVGGYTDLTTFNGDVFKSRTTEMYRSGDLNNFLAQQGSKNEGFDTMALDITGWKDNYGKRYVQPARHQQFAEGDLVWANIGYENVLGLVLDKDEETPLVMTTHTKFRLHLDKSQINRLSRSEQELYKEIPFQLQDIDLPSYVPLKLFIDRTTDTLVLGVGELRINLSGGDYTSDNLRSLLESDLKKFGNTGRPADLQDLLSEEIQQSQYLLEWEEEEQLGRSKRNLNKCLGRILSSSLVLGGAIALAPQIEKQYGSDIAKATIITSIVYSGYNLVQCGKP